MYLILRPPYFIGFRRKEFRGKLAIAITANFKNKRTTAEAVVEEISGVAFVYKQDFFNNLYEELGIALENIVYYKDETHYFVMTTKKHSLLDRKVLKKVSRITIYYLSQETVYILKIKKKSFVAWHTLTVRMKRITLSWSEYKEAFITWSQSAQKGQYT